MPEKKREILINFLTPILRREPYGIFKKALENAKGQEKPARPIFERRLESKV